MREEEIYEEICDEIRGIDLASKFPVRMKNIEQFFTSTIRTEKNLREIFDCFNKSALEDSDFSAKLAYVLNSKQFRLLEIDSVRVRSVLLQILQQNFEAASKFKQENVEKYYNSITLLGECFHRIRIGNDVPIEILGKSLLNILTAELESALTDDTAIINEHLANLVLTQVVLNGNLAKSKLTDQIKNLMFTIRKCLIEIHDLSKPSRAFLTMTLDLYYNNYKNIGKELEDYYQSYLSDYEKVKDEKRRKFNENRVPVDCQFREKLRLSMASEVKFERPSLQIDRKVEELVTGKECTSPQLSVYSDGERSPIKKWSPEKVQSPKKLKDSPDQDKKGKRSPTKVPSNKTPTKSNSNSPKAVVQVQSASNTKPADSPIKKNGVNELEETEDGASDVVEKSEAKNSNESQVTKNKIDFLDKILIDTVADQKAVIDIVDVDKRTEESSHILRQQNSCHHLNGSTTKEKSNNVKAYFREENVENLTWENPEDDDLPDTPPKLNPYSKSFLSFLENQ